MTLRTPRHVPFVSAHRGGGERHRPATYDAYTDALTSGAEYAELDIRRLADGTLVVFHDDRLGPGGPVLARLTYSELTGAAGYEVPRVTEVLSMLGGRLGAHLDLKETGYEAEVVELALRLTGDDIIATSLEDESIAAVNARFPHVATALSLGRDVSELSRAAALAVRRIEVFPARRLRACGATGIAMHQRLARLRLLSLVRARGLDAWVWTVDDDDLMRHFLRDPRVTTLITNRPRRAVELRAEIIGRAAGTGRRTGAVITRPGRTAGPSARG